MRSPSSANSAGGGAPSRSVPRVARTSRWLTALTRAAISGLPLSRSTRPGGISPYLVASRLGRARENPYLLRPLTARAISPIPEGCAMQTADVREQMIEQQVRAWDVLDERVLDVMRQVPRELFVPAGYGYLAYADLEVPLPP